MKEIMQEVRLGLEARSDAHIEALGTEWTIFDELA